MKSEYKIESSFIGRGLEERINRCLNEGWVIAGGVCAVSTTSGWEFYQALVRYTEEAGPAVASIANSSWNRHDDGV